MNSPESKPTAVVLASGGMDSCVTAAIAEQEYMIALLHVNYGQKTEKRELMAFHDICNYYAVPEERTLIASIDYLGKIGGSSLTDENIAVSDADLQPQKIPSSYVPFRNAHILSVAVGWAEVIGAQKIFIGAVEEDSSGYPDCREDFFTAFNHVISLGTKPETQIEIITPIIHLSKSQIIQKGIALNAPLYLTWSCYQSEDKACGVCDSCALRLRAFQALGMDDPIEYHKRPLYIKTK